MPQRVICLDLEGVLIPEIWIAVAQASGIESLRKTTRDVADYDELMRGRIATLADAGITLADLQRIAGGIEPLPGARSFLDALRSRHQVCILSDTFTQFAAPVMAQLGYPFILCNQLIADADGRVVDYQLRQSDGKRTAVEAFRSLQVEVLAVGDSFNDIAMLRAAHTGVLYRPSQTVVDAHPDLTATSTYDELKTYLLLQASDEQ